MQGFYFQSIASSTSICVEVNGVLTRLCVGSKIVWRKSVRVKLVSNEWSPHYANFDNACSMGCLNHPYMNNIIRYYVKQVYHQFPLSQPIVFINRARQHC